MFSKWDYTISECLLPLFNEAIAAASKNPHGIVFIGRITITLFS